MASFEHSLGSVLRDAARKLADAGFSSPKLDAELLLAHALGGERTSLFLRLDEPVPQDHLALFEGFLARRLKHEPVGRILGYRDFWNHRFVLNEATLEPRPDSETLVEQALKLLPDNPCHIIDFGTGTGCLLISVLAERTRAIGLGLDIAPLALEAARYNADMARVADRATWQEFDWEEGCLPTAPDSVDLVLSNPPYIAYGEAADLAPEVRDHDPHQALFAEDRGLAAYHILAPMAYGLLKKGGHVIFEIGHEQADAVKAVLKDAGFAAIRLEYDLAGKPRALVAMKG